MQCSSSLRTSASGRVAVPKVMKGTASALYFSPNKGVCPQPLAKNPWSPAHFRIRTFSDFRKAQWCGCCMVSCIVRTGQDSESSMADPPWLNPKDLGKGIPFGGLWTTKLLCLASSQHQRQTEILIPRSRHNGSSLEFPPTLRKQRIPKNRNKHQIITQPLKMGLEERECLLHGEWRT